MSHDIENASEIATRITGVKLRMQNEVTGAHFLD